MFVVVVVVVVVPIAIHSHPQAAATVYPLLARPTVEGSAGTVLRIEGYRVRNRLGVLECHVNNRNPAGTVQRVDAFVARNRLTQLQVGECERMRCSSSFADLLAAQRSLQTGI